MRISDWSSDVCSRSKPRQPPSLAETCDAIEACPKPVIAALHGTALGGGFEIALAAHYRIAAPGTRMGLPEITLGLIPGAGGADRPPRLAGVVQALELVVGGTPTDPRDAKATAIVEVLVH